MKAEKTSNTKPPVVPRESKKAFRFVKELDGVHEYQLEKNGLRVLLKPDHSAPVAGVMVTYHVGSRNEATGYTGATHLLEHLMFKGSKNFNKENKKTIWHLLETKGALVNATTWLDRTNYYEVVPREYLKEAIALEADRMRHAWIQEADRQSEMTVVRNEFERGENNPLEAVDKQLWALAFQAHPYHHATIGWRSDIEKVSIERLKKFYDEFYWPNNATVTVVGDFETEAVLALLDEHFGVYERAPHVIEEPYTEEPRQEGERRAVVKRVHTTNLVALGYKVPGIAHKDIPALHVLSSVLGGGKTSRLHTALVETGLASSVSAYFFPMRDATLFSVFVTLTPKTSHAEVEAKVRQILQTLPERLTKEEVARAQRAIKVAVATTQDGAYAFLSYLNEYIAGGDWTQALSMPQKVTAVRVSDVASVLKKYFVVDQSTVAWFIGTAATLETRKPKIRKLVRKKGAAPSQSKKK